MIIKYFCPICSSESLTFSSRASWNAVNQKFELYGVGNRAFCNDCKQWINVVKAVQHEEDTRRQYV